MKSFTQFLKEIFDTDNISVNLSGKSSFNAKPNLKRSGSKSHVVDDPNDQTMVRRISHKNDDSYKKYVSFLQKHSIAQKNPHFPRIYEVKDYNYKYSKNYKPLNLKTTWKVEKFNYDIKEFIYEHDLITAYERVKQLLDLYLKDDYVSKKYNRFLSMFDKIQHYPDLLKKPRANEMAHEILESAAMEMFMYDLRDVSKIKLKSYRIALSIIKSNIDKVGVLDWYDDNIMVRVTQYGPQLVFVDPYFDG